VGRQSVLDLDVVNVRPGRSRSRGKSGRMNGTRTCFDPLAAFHLLLPRHRCTETLLFAAETRCLLLLPSQLLKPCTNGHKKSSERSNAQCAAHVLWLEHHFRSICYGCSMDFNADCLSRLLGFSRLVSQMRPLSWALYDSHISTPYRYAAACGFPNFDS
jgi:hypothetical protein